MVFSGFLFLLLTKFILLLKCRLFPLTYMYFLSVNIPGVHCHVIKWVIHLTLVIVCESIYFNEFVYFKLGCKYICTCWIHMEILKNISEVNSESVTSMKSGGWYHSVCFLFLTSQADHVYLLVSKSNLDWFFLCGNHSLIASSFLTWLEKNPPMLTFSKFSCHWCIVGNPDTQLWV